MSSRLDLPAQFGVLFLRLWVGLNFALYHGLDKARDPEAFLESVEMRRFPSYRTLGWCVIVAELLGGLLVTVGLRTRLAAGALLAEMVLAAYVAQGAAPWSQKELPLAYAVMLLFLVLHGAGTPSFDAWLERRRRRASPW